jgi:outer membrane usher protein
VIGETDAHGRLLVTGLRAYEQNRIGVVLDDLPITASVANDEIMVTPGARSGAIADFALAQEGGGEVQILGPNGAPLPAGSILTRRGDGARFVVGADGKAFIDARADTVLDGEHCSLTVALSDFSNGMPLTCRG